MKLNIIKVSLSILIAASCTMLWAQNDSTREEYPLMDYRTPKTYIVKDIEMIGVKSLDPNILIITSGMSVGDTITIPGEYITDATRKLWSQRYFSDIRVEVETQADSARLFFYLTERPRVYNWNFAGIKKSETTDLKERLNLKRGTELSDFRIQSSILEIRKYFDDKGYRHAAVDVVQTTDTTSKNAVDVTFKIDKGPKVKIGKVIFEGNEVFSDATLRKALKKTKQKGPNIFVSSKFNNSKYEEDKDNLIEFLNSKGYRNAAILSDSIYDINNKRIGIVINVEEGNKFYFRNISFLGNSKYPQEQLFNILGLSSGEIYDSKALYKRLGIGKNANPDDMSITSLYQDAGYIMFQLEPQETVVGADSIDLEIKLIEGKQATVNRVDFTGNNLVNDPVIRREMDILPGELYSRALLISTMRRLSALGHFNPENMQPDIKPVSNELIDISFAMEEQPSDRFEISGGWGANMFVGSVGVTLNNFAMRDFFKKGAWKPYPRGDNQQLSVRGQTNGSYFQSYSLSFTEPWFGGKKPHSLTTSFYYSSQTDAYYITQKSNKHFRTIGGSLGLGRRLKWPDHNFSLYNELMYQAYNLKDWDYFIMTNGTANIVALRTVLSRSTIDQPLYPRSGSEISGSVTLTPPYSLFDGVDYSDPNLSQQQRYRWIEYHKWLFKALWYLPVSNNNKLVLKAAAEGGFIGSYNNSKVSPFEGYQLGGDGMSGYNVYGVDIIGLRGYKNGSLTPSGEYSRAYNKFTVELRYPFILKPSSTIYGLVFAEGGNAFDNVRHVDPFLIKRSLGVGVRLFLPVVGMIGVDWGYGFDKAIATGEKGGGNFHFVIGQQF